MWEASQFFILYLILGHNKILIDLGSSYEGLVYPPMFQER
jgi:hypothetical protein